MSTQTIANLMEVVMMICFGASWPVNFRKAWKAGTAKGSSLPFFLLIELGYACGAAAKITNHQINYILIFYFINMVAVAANIVVYFINCKKDWDRSRGKIPV